MINEIGQPLLQFLDLLTPINYNDVYCVEILMVSRIFGSFRKKHFFQNYARIYEYIHPYKIRAMIALLVSVPIGILDAAIPAGLKYYIDGIANTGASLIVSLMPLLIVSFTVLQSILTYVANYMNAWVGASISNKLKYDLYRKLMRFPASFFDQNASGTIQMRFNTDVDTACTGLLNNIKSFTKKVFNSIGYLGVLLFVSWKLALVAIVVLGLALLPLKGVKRRIKMLTNELVSSGAAIASSYIETFNGNRIISSYNLYKYQADKFLDKLKNYFRFTMKVTQRTGILSPIMHLVVGIGVAIIVFVGNYFISTGEMTAGDFTAFVTSVILLYQPIKTLGDDISAVQLSLLAMERIFVLLEDVPAICNDVNLPKVSTVSKSIEYKDVSFSYDKSREILHKINLKINAGETVAFVGNSGGGKTTLVNLLPRFYDVTSGEILVDGTDIRDMELDSLRDQISVVFQDNFLFDGTIEDNILLGKKDATEQEIEQALLNACLAEFVNSLKNGIKTPVGERGVLLSGGQKQRVAIARAFIKNAPIVILDEATSALDNKSESIVQKAINNLMHDRTVLVIAHRLSTVKNADKIVVVNYGKIAEVGTHDELIVREGGFYRSLYESQIMQK